MKYKPIAALAFAAAVLFSSVCDVYAVRAAAAKTDPVRQDRILDVLTVQADRLQILILTCHPDRYRGVGEKLSFD